MSPQTKLSHFKHAGLSAIPQAIQDLPQAVTWDAGPPDLDTGKFSKYPKGLNNTGKAWNTAAQWFTNLHQAIQRAEELGRSGVGIVLPARVDGLHLVAFDWDGLDFNDDERMTEIRQDWESLGKPYMEVSPSGKGLRAFVLSKIPARDASRARSGGGKDELFCSSKGRWMTVTGDCREVGDVPEATEAVVTISKRWNAPKGDGSRLNFKDKAASSPEVSSRGRPMFAHLMPGAGFRWPDKLLQDGDGRERTMLRFAHSLRNQGYSQEEIEEACLKARTERFAPGHELGEDVVLDRARRLPKEYRASAGGALSNAADVATDVLVTGTDEGLNDTGNAERFISACGGHLRYVPELKAWLIWRDGHWRFDSFGEVMEFAKQVAKGLYAEAANASNQSSRGMVARWANSSLQITRLKAMVELSQPRLAVSVTQLDADPWMLGVKNGVVDLRKGELRDARPEDFITKLADVAFDPSASCPVWEAFVKGCMGGSQDLVDLIQIAAGYSLTGLTTEQVFFFLYGSGANGKSTFINALREIMGANAIQSQPETIMAQRNASASGPTPEIARLARVRLVAMVETEEGQRLAESRLKQLTGGDAITARVLHGSPFDFVPRMKLWISGNHKPVIRGDDHGIWRRIVMVPFNVVLKPEQRDKELPNKLRAEFSGILSWLLQGCLKWQQHGLAIPPEVERQVEQYRSEMDLIAQWLDDCCTQEPQSRCPARGAYISFSNWCRQGGHNPVSEVRFAQKMAERGFEHTSDRRGKSYLRLSANQTDIAFRFACQ